MAKNYEFGTISVTKEFKRKLELLCRPGQRLSGVIEELYNIYCDEFENHGFGRIPDTENEVSEESQYSEDTETSEAEDTVNEPVIELTEPVEEPEIQTAIETHQEVIKPIPQEAVIEDKQPEIKEVPEVPEKQEVPTVPQNDVLHDVNKYQPNDDVKPERQGELTIPESYMSLSEAQAEIKKAWGKDIPVEYLEKWANDGVLKLREIGNSNYIERASLEDMLNKYKLG